MEGKELLAEVMPAVEKAAAIEEVRAQRKAETQMEEEQQRRRQTVTFSGMISITVPDTHRADSLKEKVLRKIEEVYFEDVNIDIELNDDLTTPG